LPYFHAGGLITVFCMLIQGATVVVNKKWNEEGFLRILQDFKITTINIVPPIMDFLVKHPLVDSFKLGSLKTVFVGAAKCDEVLLRSLKRRLPSLEHVTQLYGLTEAGVLLFVTPIRNPHLSSVGRAMPGVQAKILDEHGDLMKFGEVGRLVVKAPTYMQGYLGEHLAVPYGWFDTGDLACIDDQGFVYITGRTKDMIKVRGWQVNPFEIEEAIKANVVGVKDCAVVGVDHDVDGQRPKAFIVGEPDVNEIINFVKDTFTSYKHLCGVEIVDAIPRTPSGKILRRELVSSIGSGG
uniref:Long-chain fatty acid--CoA ligase n=1 Tax=Haemonchus placei TaxID=6290 RepID=A0A0N4W4U6_HAEPC